MPGNRNKNEDPIAVFDSGVGGISVLRALLEEMPNENYRYYGDSANAPYGTKSLEQSDGFSCRPSDCRRGESGRCRLQYCDKRCRSFFKAEISGCAGHRY